MLDILLSDSLYLGGVRCRGYSVLIWMALLLILFFWIGGLF